MRGGEGAKERGARAIFVTMHQDQPEGHRRMTQTTQSEYVISRRFIQP